MKFLTVNFKKSSGQGLLEATIAIGIILFGLGAVLTLTLKNIVAANNSSQRLVAAQLAREAIEVVRARRDSNWLLASNNKPNWQWDCGLMPIDSPDPNTCNLAEDEEFYNSNCITRSCGIALQFDISQIPPEFVFRFYDTRDVDDENRPELKMVRAPTTAGDYWTQGLAVTTGLLNTGYRRLLVIDPVCQSSDQSFYTRTGYVKCNDDEIKIGVRAEVKVSWQAGGFLGLTRRNVTLVEYLYNWR